MTKRLKYLEENLGSLQVNLSAQDMRRLDVAAPRGVTASERYPDMSTVNR